MKRPAILSLTTLFALASPALAHPHVFADIRSELMLAADGTVTGVRVQWTTDKAYAQVALEGMDTNGDGQYDDAELARLTEENLTALADYDYFVHFKFNGEKQAHGVAADGMQRYNPEDGRLTLVFTVPLRTPLDPHKGEVSLKVYDPEFYIDFEYVEEKPLLLSAAPPAGCTARLLPPKTDAATDQTRAMLATKGTDWKPENDEDYGGLFAPDAVMKCG
ncbi:MAG: DUF1007 family protein [Hyphomicrobiales bacterium]